MPIQHIVGAIRGTYLIARGIGQIPENIRAANQRRRERLIEEQASAHERQELKQTIRTSGLDIESSEVSNAIGYYMLDQRMTEFQAYAAYHQLIRKGGRYPSDRNTLEEAGVRLRSHLRMLTPKDHAYLSRKKAHLARLRTAIFFVLSAAAFIIGCVRATMRDFNLANVCFVASSVFMTCSLVSYVQRRTALSSSFANGDIPSRIGNSLGRFAARLHRSKR